MAICTHLAPNGEKSALYQALEQKYGPDRAHDLWTAIRTEQFKNAHPWEGKDKNGEPDIKWVEHNLALNKVKFQAANAEQSTAISSIQDFIKNGDPQSFFTLEGKAGTGKTTIASEALAPFIEAGKNVLIMALAHKAKLVLEQKLEERFGEKAITAKSIAGGLGMNMDLETGKFGIDWENQYNEPPIAQADIVVVDEASMVNEQALKEIMSRKPANTKVIFMGDIGQLAPIREQGDLNSGKPSPVFSQATKSAKLLERVRQGEESPILPFADKFWDNSQSKTPSADPAPGERQDVVSTKGALVFSKTMNEILPQVLDQYKQALDTNNPNLIKTVVYRNDVRRMINNAVRRKLFGEEAIEKQIIAGDMMMFQDNYTPKGWKEPISNATEIQVKHVEEGEYKGYKTWKSSFIYDKGMPVEVHVLDNGEILRHQQDVSNLFAEAKAMPKGPARTRKLQDAWVLKRAFAPLDYSYAITSHKSQGSTYDSVVVVESDINSVNPISAREKSQSIYTALTRAKTTTVVVDGRREANKDNVKAAFDLAQQKREAPQVLPQVPAPESANDTGGPKVSEEVKEENQNKELPTPVDTKQPESTRVEPTEIISRNFEPQDQQPFVPEDQMIKNIKALYDEAILNPDKQYNINYEFRNDRFRYNSGYTAHELANLFDAAGDIPTNVKFSDKFTQLIANSSKRILDSLGEFRPAEAINRDGKAINEDVNHILLTKRDANGKILGYFTSGQHQAIVDSTMFLIHNFLQRDPNLGANAIIKAFKGFEAYAQRSPGSDWAYIFNQRARIASDVLDQLSQLGYKMDSWSRNRIILAVDQLKDLGGVETKLEEFQHDYDKAEQDQEVLDHDNKEFLEAVGHGLQDWGEVSFEHDPKDTASARMKMFIAMLPDMDRAIYKPKNVEGAITDLPSLKALKADPKLLKQTADRVNRKDFWAGDDSQAIADLLQQNHPLLAKKNFLGLAKIVDFEATFQSILENLADSPVHDYQTYTNRLIATGQPNLIHLVDQLNKADESIQNEFARLASTQYTKLNMMLFTKTVEEDGTESYSLRPTLSNRYSQRLTIIKNWKEQQKLAEIMKINPSGDRVIDVQRAKDKWMPALQHLQKMDWTKDENVAQAKNFVKDMLRISGVELSNDMVNDLFQNMESWTRGTSLAGGIGKQFSITGDGKPSGMFSAFIMKMAGLSAEADLSNADNISDLEARAEVNNPLYTESTTMNILARVAAAHTPTLHNGSSKNSEGKDIWNYTMHTKLSHAMIDMKENFDAFYDRFKNVDIAKNNFLLSVLQKRPLFRDKIQLEYLDGIKPIWGRRGTMRTDMSDREQLLMSLAMFQNQGAASSHYFSLTHSDKTTTPLFKNMPRFKVGNADMIPQEVVGNANSIFFNIFKSEYDRIINQSKQSFNDARYDKGKGLFYFMPEFNKEAMQGMVTDGYLTQKEYQTIWMNGDTLTNYIRPNVELPIINKILNKIVEDRINNVTEVWKKNGIVSEEGNLFDKKYLTNLWKENGIGREKTNEDKMLGRPGSLIIRNGQQLTKAEANDIVVRHAAKDYALNYFVHNVGLSQLFYGDPALTFKGGKTDMESVDLTLKEYGKRLAKDIAPGLDPYFRPQDRKFNSITLADHNQREAYLDKLSKIAPDYAKVNATDAQEFTTVAEHLKVMYANGVINSKLFGDMMNIVQSAKGKYYEFTNPEHLAVIMQPMKPVYAGQRDVENGAVLEDYVKTSSIPLYPPATAGLGIDGLRMMMEKQGIDRAPFESGKKIGSPTNPLKVFGEDGSFKEPSQEEINGAITQLDRKGFRIQQEVPYDEVKEAIKTVSQMNKLITGGIEGINGFKIGGKEYSGAEIRAKKEQIRKSMIGYQLNDFFKSWGVDQGRITNKSRVYDKLISLSGNDKLTMNEMQSLLGRDSDGNLWIPLQYNTSVDNLESMMMSMIKDIAQVKMPGKSFVQASSAGWTFKKESSVDKSKVVWVDGYDGSPLKVSHIGEDGQVKPAQVLIPFNFLTKQGNSAKVEDYMIERDNRKVIDTTKIPKELLQLIGARIPNQDYSSMHAIEVVGFLPKNMGDTIIVPAGFTKQMGADFDVDKLYTYRRPYYHNQDANTFHESRTPDTMEKHQSDYFDIHWSVLTHPEMLDKILKPLDKPDLKAENKLLGAKKPEGYNYFDHTSQLQDFQNGKDAKMLVALTSLSNVFNSVIQNKNLYIFHDELITGDDGKVTSKKVRDFINFKDEHSDETLKLTNLSGNGKSTYTEQDGGTVSDSSTRTKGDNHSTVQSAAVDNAKDRALDNLNITPDTYPALDALNQLETQDGKAVNLKYGTRLLTQPIIKEFASEMKKGNDSLSTKYNPSLKESVIENLRQKYIGEHDGKEVREEAAKILFDPQLLLKAQKMEPGSKEYAIHQVAALDLFEKLDQIGKRLSELRSYFNQDTKGAGKNLLQALDKSDKLTKLDQAPIDNASQIFRNEDNTVTEQGFTAQATTGVAVNILTQILPYDKYTPLFSELTALSGKLQMSLDHQKDVLRAVRSFTYNSGQHWWRDATTERGRLFYNKDESISLARRVELAKRTWGKDNYFLQRLDPVIGDTKFSPDFIEYQAATVGRVDEDNNIRGWTELLMSEDKDQRELGEDLLRYAYLTGGIQDANSFIKFVPNSYISNTDFGNMLKAKGEAYQGPISELNNVNNDMPGFVTQYIQHYPERAFNIDREVFGELKDDINYPEAFQVNPFDLKQGQSALYDEEQNPRRYVSYRSAKEGKWILYQAEPLSNGDMMYVRIDTLGNQYTDEYNGEKTGPIRSIFTENRSLAENVPAEQTLQRFRRQNQEQKGQRPLSILDELGIESGGSDYNKALAMIASHDHVEESLRSVAKYLSDTPMNLMNKDAIEALKIRKYEPKISIDDSIPTQALAHMDGEIKINPNQINDINEGAEAFIHEALHQRLMHIITLSGYDKRFDFSGALAEVGKKFQEQHPEVMKHLAELDRIRYAAYEKFKQIHGDLDIDAKVARGQTLTQREGLLYALRDMQEFTVHVLSDKRTQEFLNSITNEKGSVLHQVWKAMADIITAIGRSLGKWVKKDSLLPEAIYHTLSLTRSEEFGDLASHIVKKEDMRVNTEAQADNVKHVMDEAYNQETKVKKDGLGYTIINAKAKSKATAPIMKVVEKMNEQIAKAYRDISKGELEERIQARARYNELKQQKNDLLRENNLDRLAQIANSQLAWIDKVMDNPKASATQVQAAIEASNIWGEVMNIMYGGTTGAPRKADPTFSTIEEQANLQRIKLINENAARIVTDALSPRTSLKAEDFAPDEINRAEAMFLTLSRMKPKLLSAIGARIREGANNRDEHMQRIHDQLSNLKKKMDKAGVTPDKFMQKDSWGLVDRLSNQWHEYISDMAEKRDNGLESLARMENVQGAGAKKAKIWQDYWNNLRQVATFVDTRLFFDEKTGAKLPNTEKHLTQLGLNIGDHDYAKELLEQAHEKYQKYVQERKIQLDYLQSQIQLLDHEKQGKTLAEQEALRKKLIADEFTKWLHWNSPSEFLERMNGKGDLKYVNNGDRWLVMAPRGDHPEFYDDKYDILMKDEKLKPIFQEYKSLIQEMTSYLPPEHSEKLPPGFLPIVSHETILSLNSMLAKLKNWDITLLHKLTASEGEEEWRKSRPDEIPIRYTRPEYNTKENAQRSTDLIRVAEVFSMMALHYRYLSPILDEVNLAESIVKEANRQRVSGNIEGAPLRNAMDVIKYNKDKAIYQKPVELEGKVDSPIYSIKPWEQVKIQAKIKELTQEKDKLNQQLLENMENEAWGENEEIQKRIDEIDEKLTDYEKQARYIYASKLADAVISINQLKALAYNPFSAVTNFTFAAVSAHVYATGRTDYDPKHLAQAMGIATHAMKNYYTFGAAMDGPARKIRALMERSQVMTELTGTDHLAIRNKSHLREALSPYNWQKSGDYYAKGSMMIAMMLKKTVEVTEKETGEKKTIRLWDALDESGKWDTSKYQEDKRWYSDDVAQQTEWNKFRDKMRGVATIVFGNQDKNSPLLAKKYMLARLAGQFRLSWFPEGLNIRFGSERYDPLLGREVKGRYRSFGTLGLFTSSVIMARSILDSIPGINIDRFKGLTDKEGKEIKEVDMENMRRNFTGLAWTVSITAAILMIRALFNDNKKGKNKTADDRQRQLLINMLIRSQQDLMMYSSPSVWDTVTGNIIPATNVVTDAIKAMKATGHYMFGDTHKDKHAFETWVKHITRATPILNNINKVDYMFNRDLDSIQR